MLWRATLLTGLLVLGLAAPAGAADLTLTVEPGEGVRFGAETTMTGTLSEAGAPLAAQPVVLESRRYPFDGEWRQETLGTTAADGSFTLTRGLERNHDLRVRHPESGAVSAIRRAYVFPAFKLSFVQRRGGLIRITQVYTVPRDVRLTARTRFFIGRQGARGARLRAEVRTKRVRAGRYVARATVRIPDSYRGRFRYASCFRYSTGSGMGDPDRDCPRELVRLG